MHSSTDAISGMQESYYCTYILMCSICMFYRVYISPRYYMIVLLYTYRYLLQLQILGQVELCQKPSPTTHMQME